MDNKELTKKRLEIIRAYFDGKDIEYRRIGSYCSWKCINIISTGYLEFVWNVVEYRIRKDSRLSCLTPRQRNRLTSIIDTMEAYLQDLPIISKSIGSNTWHLCLEPCWDWESQEYGVLNEKGQNI